jgi:hypothetical protein
MIISETRIKRGCCLIFVFLILLTIGNLPADAQWPSVSETMVTDITTRSFSVIWKTDVPSTAGLKVFNGPDCTVEITNSVTITPHPTVSGDAAIKTAAEDSGVMKIMVAGLDADTEYCYQTVSTAKANASLVTIHPPEPGRVVTQAMTVRTYVDNATGNILPFSNDLIVFPVFDPDGTTPSDGSLLVAEVYGSAVTAFVGDGITAPDSITDMNNLFYYGENMDCQGGEILKLSEFSASCTLDKYRKVPADTGLSEVLEPASCFDPADLDCNDTVNILDILRDVGGFNTSSGDNCFNSDLDMDKNNSVNILDILTVVGKFGSSNQN